MTANFSELLTRYKRKKCDITIRLATGKRTYSALDTIRGIVSVNAKSEVDIADITIKLRGISKTSVPFSPNAPSDPDCLSARHDFLHTTQPDVAARLPSNSILEKGRTYDFPFAFTLPEHLLPGTCNHLLSHPNVHDAHLQLPPTFGDPDVSQEYGLADKTSGLATIRYFILAQVTQWADKNTASQAAVTATQTCPLRVIPTVNELPPSTFWASLESNAKSAYALRKETRLKKRGHAAAVLIVEAEQPLNVSIARDDTSAQPYVTTTSTAMLRFDHGLGALGTVMPLPSLERITSKLKSYTHYATTPWRDFPSDKDMGFNPRTGYVCESTALPSPGVGNIIWRSLSHDAKRSPSNIHLLSDGSPSASSQSAVPPSDDIWTPSPGSSSSAKDTAANSRIAKLIIPTYLSTHHITAPTFCSCLVARRYTVAHCLHFKGLDAGFAVVFEVPIRVSFVSASPNKLPHALSLGSEASSSASANCCTTSQAGGFLGQGIRHTLHCTDFAISDRTEYLPGYYDL